MPKVPKIMESLRSDFLLTSVRPQMVDFGSEQGLSDFETGGVAGYVEDLKRAKTPLRAKRCRLWMGTSWSGFG